MAVEGAAARPLVDNSGDAPPELTVDPWADTCRIPPEPTFTVLTHVPDARGWWPAADPSHEPFEADRRPDPVTVRPFGACHHLTDRAGIPLGAADWECPQGPPAC